MTTANQAIVAIRHVVQAHGDAQTVLGQTANLPGITWFGSLLGWSWPPSYLGVLAKHDGVRVQDAILFSFLESFELFLLVHDKWHRSDAYWPVSTDGCGNYTALALGERGAE